MSRTKSSALSSLTLGLGLLVVATPRPLAAATILVPIVYGAHGRNDVSWVTEVRITNRSATAKSFAFVDWIGTPGWRPSSHTIPPHSTTSLGGAGIFGSFVPLTGAAAVGLAICEADPDLLVQSAVLSGFWSSGGVSYSCSSYDGGGFLGIGCPGPAGAGPIIEGLTFANPGVGVYIPWMHTVWDRRTNLVLVNPDDIPAHVTVSVVSQDGSTTSSEGYTLSPRSYNQIDDLFLQPRFSAIRDANRNIDGGGASANIVSDSRLLVMAFVISNYNSSLTVSLPR